MANRDWPAKASPHGSPSSPKVASASSTRRMASALGPHRCSPTHACSSLEKATPRGPRTVRTAPGCAGRRRRPPRSGSRHLEHGARLQGPGQLRGRRPPVGQGDDPGQPLMALQGGPGPPVPAEVGGQPQREVGVAARHRPVQGRPQVVVVGVEQPQPAPGGAVDGGPLGQVEAPGGVAGGHRPGLAGLGQPLGPVGPHRLQHPEPRRLPAGRHHQRPVHQPEQPLQHVPGVEAVAGADHFGGRHRPATREHRQPPPQPPVRLLQQLPAPVDGGPQGLLARRRRCARPRPAAGTGRRGGPRSRPPAGPAPGTRPARWPGGARPGGGTARPPPGRWPRPGRSRGRRRPPARRTAAPRRSRPAPPARPRHRRGRPGWPPRRRRRGRPGAGPARPPPRAPRGPRGWWPGPGPPGRPGAAPGPAPRTPRPGARSCPGPAAAPCRGRSRPAGRPVAGAAPVGRPPRPAPGPPPPPRPAGPGRGARPARPATPRPGTGPPAAGPAPRPRSSCPPRRGRTP